MLTLFFLLKFLKASGLDKGYLESGIKDKAFTVEYKTEKWDYFLPTGKKKVYYERRRGFLIRVGKTRSILL